MIRVVVCVGFVLLGLLMGGNITSLIPQTIGNNMFLLLDSNMHTNCLVTLKLSQENCFTLKSIMIGMLISSGLLILLWNTMISYMLGAMSLGVWILLYLNPWTDSSSTNFDWFMQAMICMIGIVVLGMQNK